VPLTAAGDDVGTVTVVGWTLAPAEPPRTGRTIAVDVLYEATADMSLADGDWEILLGDGTQLPLATDPSDQLAVDLRAGESRELTLVGDLPETDEVAFLVYLDLRTGAITFAVPIE
jgi:hypothetical protein